MKKNKTEKYENDRREGNKEIKRRQKQKCRLEIEETKSKILKKMQFLWIFLSNIQTSICWYDETILTNSSLEKYKNIRTGKLTKFTIF